MKVEFNEYKKEYEIFLGDLFIDNDGEIFSLMKVDNLYYLLSLRGTVAWTDSYEDYDELIKKIKGWIVNGLLAHISQKEYKLKVVKI